MIIIATFSIIFSLVIGGFVIKDFIIDTNLLATDFMTAILILIVIGSIIMTFIIANVHNILQVFQNKFNNNRKNITKIKMPGIKNVPLYKEITADGNIIHNYFLIMNYRLSFKKHSLMLAILLKWLQLGKIEITENTEKNPLISNKKDKYAIDITKLGEFDNRIEEKLAAILKDVCGGVKDNTLNYLKFRNWLYTQSNAKRFASWYDSAWLLAYNDYLKKDLIKEHTNKNVLKTYELMPELTNEAEHILGLKKYLLNYGSMEQKEEIDVVLWGEYLIIATMLGINKKIFTNFQTINSDLVSNSFEFVAGMEFISALSESSYTLSESNARSSHSTSDGSGGGGFSDGGSDSFGGDSGGGFR